MCEQNVVFVISGPSAVGKTRIVKRLGEYMPRLKTSISVTTRQPRDDETNGIDYYFVDEDRFNLYIENNDLIEWVDSLYGKYGTLKQTIEDLVKNRNDVVLALDPAGMLKLKESIPQAISFFLLPETYIEIKERLEQRGKERGIHSEKDLEDRLLSVRNYIKQAWRYDYILINKGTRVTTELIVKIIEIERMKLKKDYDLKNWISRELGSQRP